MIEWRFRQWYHVHEWKTVPEDYTEQWRTFQEAYKKEESWLKNQKLQQESMAETTKEVGVSLLKDSLTLLLQVLKKVKSHITKGR